MESYRYEFTIAELLNMHRDWIMGLYVDEQKSEAEISQKLYERQFTVSPAQIHRCLLDWCVITSPTTQPQYTTTACYTFTNDWEIINHSIFDPHADSNNSSIASNPTDIDLYNKRPLPPLPSSSSRSKSDLSFKDTRYPKGKAYDKDKLQLTCISSFEGFDSRSEPISRSNIPLQNYVLDSQIHERLAVGLGAVPRHMNNDEHELKESTESSYRTPRKSRRENNAEKRAKKQ
ncbi:hypothetical protein BJ878DRAFT_125313 [Calycina marina]|uniref:Uncharacterized protein n=1 Tax=Calycina marina TaxID=1763456 RepID=A0A9P7Z0E6_9HELO|nr:hypothetical protein BJ878DRAFT_125313 [Calycina marina]